MSKNGTVLFDFDGVLVSSFDLCFSLSQNVNIAQTPEEYRAQFEGNIFSSVFKGEETAEEKRASLLADPWFVAYLPKLLEHSVVSEMETLIPQLAQTHDLYVVSSSLSSAIATFLKKHDLRDSFRDILGSDIETNKSVKIQSALTSSGFAPERALMITDTLGDMREAQHVGVKSIGVTWGFHGRERLERGDPYAIAETPGQLYDHIQSYFDAL